MQAFSIAQFQAMHERLRKTSDTDYSGIHKAANAYESHSLNAVTDNSLMDRVDSKYLLTIDTLINGLSDLNQDYTALEIDSNRVFTYQNTYFDSDNLNYYLQHHNGKLNRHKVRYRRYKETNSEFFEIKFKTNKRRTVKERTQLPETIEAESVGQKFALSLLPDSEVSKLSPVLHVNYQRITLTHKQARERLTFDFDLRFSRVGSAEQTQIPDLAIAEHKRYGKPEKTAFQSFVKRHAARNSSFSKYCIGCCLTAKQPLKMNRFRPILRKVNSYSTNRTSLDI
ncbi:MAG: polyphosphate polymerase domain-containing protein [Pseudomonadales bacterium]